MRWIAVLFLAGATMAADFDDLWGKHKVPELEQEFKKLLPEAQKHGLDYELQLKTQIARTLGLQGKFDEAHKLLDEVEPKLTDETKVARIRYLLERGGALNSSKHPDKARPLFLEAWEFGRKTGQDGYAVDAAHMMAIVEPLEKRDVWQQKAMELAESSDSELAKRWLGTLYNNMGWDAHDRGDYEKALELHRKGWEWRKARQPDSRATRIAKWSVAKQLRMLKRYDEALKLQRELLQEWEKAGEEDGFVYEELGECLLALGKPDEAKPWFKKAYEKLKEIDWVREDKARIERLEKLSK